MQFPGEKRKYTQKTFSIRDDQLAHIDAESDALKRSRNQQVEYMIDLAIQTGSMNNLLSQMAIQYAEMSARAQLDHEVIASYDQVDRLKDQVTFLDDNVRNLVEIIKRLSVTIVQEKEGATKV